MDNEPIEIRGTITFASPVIRAAVVRRRALLSLWAANVAWQLGCAAAYNNIGTRYPPRPFVSNEQLFGPRS